MADHPQFKDGTGALFRSATDEVVIGGVTVHVSRLKAGWGADNAYADVQDTPGGRLPVGGGSLGNPDDVEWPGSGPGNITEVLKALHALMAAGIPLSGAVSLLASEGVKGQFGGITVNASGTITRPGDTTPYTAGDRVADVGGAYPTLSCARLAGGSFEIPRMRLSTNNTAIAGAVSMKVRLWAGAAAPIYGGGDNTPYAVTAGDNLYLGSYTGLFETFADKSTAILQPDYGPALVDLAVGQNVYWDLQTLDGFTPGAANWFAATAEVRQD